MVLRAQSSDGALQIPPCDLDFWVKAPQGAVEPQLAYHIAMAKVPALQDRVLSTHLPNRARGHSAWDLQCAARLSRSLEDALGGGRRPLQLDRRAVA